MSALHLTAGGLDSDENGFVISHCSCGWRMGPMPDEETAIDALMEHAYERGWADSSNQNHPPASP